MNERPVYIDMHGGAGKSGPSGPAAWRYWSGQEPLWKAFWGAFVFGHGLLLAFLLGILIFAAVFGMAVGDGATYKTPEMITVLAGVALICLLYVIWALVSVWRSTSNCVDKRWGRIAQVIVFLYVCAWIAPVYFVLNA